MKLLILTLLLTLGLSAKTITPNDVYAEVMLIQDEIHSLLKHYDIKHEHEKILNQVYINTKLMPRNTWQKSYEILVKINMMRTSHNLARIEPVGMEPVLNLNPDLVYEQTQRILTEIKIFKTRLGMKRLSKKIKTFKNKTPLDVFNALSHVSFSFDELNRSSFTPSYVFAETMRIYDDLSVILEHLKIKDTTIPTSRNDKATPSDTFRESMKILSKIKTIQFAAGIKSVDFSAFIKEKPTPSDVFTMTQMILSELQPIKAYIGLYHYITPPAVVYTSKTPADVDQLMKWNLRKISLIGSLK